VRCTQLGNKHENAPAEAERGVVVGAPARCRGPTVEREKEWGHLPNEAEGGQLLLKRSGEKKLKGGESLPETSALRYRYSVGAPEKSKCVVTKTRNCVGPVYVLRGGESRAKNRFDIKQPANSSRERLKRRGRSRSTRTGTSSLDEQSDAGKVTSAKNKNPQSTRGRMPSGISGRHVYGEGARRNVWKV